MKKTELRIGNQILIDGVVVTVDERTLFDFDYDGRVKEPIPLTEEWLLRFGFEKDIDDCFVSTNGYYTYHLGGVFNASDAYYTISTGVLFIHQLQNLYYALTGEELPLKQ